MAVASNADAAPQPAAPEWPAGLVPDALPAGAVAAAEHTDVVNDGSGGNDTYRTQRFNLPGDRGMLLVELAEGADVTARFPHGAAASQIAVGNARVAHAVHASDMREIRWRTGPNSVLSLVGTGEVGTGHLVAAAASLAPSLRPKGRPVEEPAPEPEGELIAAAYVGLPGDTGTNNNMRGSGTAFTDDWGSTDGANALTCETCYPSRGNLIGVWQAILWADGGYYNNASTLIYQTNCDVDGVFGSKTRAVTVQWQYSRQLTSDGKVGPATWGRADDRLRLSSTGQLGYTGSNRTLYFQRTHSYGNGQFNYAWSWNNSGYYYTGYENIYMIRSTTNCVRG